MANIVFKQKIDTSKVDFTGNSHKYLKYTYSMREQN